MRLAFALAACLLVTLTGCSSGSVPASTTLPPVANAGGPYTGVAGAAVPFSGSGSSDPQGQALTFAWSFGDGSTGTGATPSHIYTAAGTYAVSLTVTDSSSLTGTATGKATIAAALQPPVANPGGPYTGSAGTPLSFNGTASSDPQGQALTFAWSFGDGSTGTGATPSHIYTAAGTYAVSLTVTDSSSLTGTATGKATIAAALQPPVANPGGPYTGSVGTPLTFNGTASSDPQGQALTYAWTFGDGNNGAGASPSHTYTSAGAFSVTLTVTDTNNLSGTATTSATMTAVLKSITVTPANISIAQGKTTQYAATGKYSDGSTRDISSSITWSSGTTSVATISGGGLATAIKAGSSVITATLGSISGTATLTVTGPTLQSIAVAPGGVSIPAGLKQAFTAMGTYSDGTTRTITGLVAWSSGTASVATIAGTGVATSLTSGTSLISAALGSVSGSTTLAVTPAALQSIAVTPFGPSTPAGIKIQFTATGSYSDGSVDDITSSVTWSSGTPSTSTITTAGLATGLVTGSSVISAAKGGFTGSSILTVSPATLQSIAVTPATLSIPVGLAVQFTASGTYSDGKVRDITSSVAWASGDVSVASVATGGVADSIVAGSSTISATLEGVNGAASLTVTTATLESIAVTPLAPTISANSTIQLSATGSYSDATVQNITSFVTWSSGTTSVATVDENGLVSSLAVDTSIITATWGNISGNSTITVTPAVTLGSPLGQTWAIICYPQSGPAGPGTSCAGTSPAPTLSGNDTGYNLPGSYSVGSGQGDFAIGITSLAGSSGPYTYVYAMAGSSPTNEDDMAAQGWQQYYFQVSSQTATSATVVVNATTSVGAPLNGGVSAVVGFNCPGGAASLTCSIELQSNNCAVVDPTCNTFQAWVNKPISVPTNTAIVVYTEANNLAAGAAYLPSATDAQTWALANLFIELDPTFGATHPDAQLTFSPGVNQTGPSSLPVAGQP